MFLGYPEDHPGDTYKFVNMSTNKILLSRDVTWLNKTFGTYYDLPKGTTTQVSNPDDWEDIPEEEEQDKKPLPNLVKNLATEGELPTTYRGRTRNETVNEREEIAAGVYEMAFVHDEKQFEEPKEEDEPTTFKEAWFHPDLRVREKWRQAIEKEYHDMLERGVWEEIKMNKVPTNRRLLGTKWVFKIKRNGTYRARLVVLGYHQVPGLEFQENFAPVVNDITFKMKMMKAPAYSNDLTLKQNSYMTI